MLTRILAPLFVLAVALLAPATTQGPPASASGATAAVQPPAARTLDGGWQFRFDPAGTGVRSGWQQGAWDQQWQDVAVPHVFNPRPVDEEFLGTVGWYRMKLVTPETPEGFGWALRFEGVRRKAAVYLNGRLLGRNRNAYEPFTLPASGLRPAGQENSLVVRVSNRRPASLREGWWNWGGITRPVHLEPVGKVEWADVGVLSDTDCSVKTAIGCRALARADGLLLNHTGQEVMPELSVTLTSPSGEVTTRTQRTPAIKPFGKLRYAFTVPIEGTPALWSPPRPNLYDVRIEVRLGDTVTQVGTRRFGFRFIRVRNGRLFLNGHRLEVRGASIQEDLPGRGPALRPVDQDQIVDDLERLGANVTRAQYPLSEQLLSKFDEAGILVWSQAPVYHEDEALKTRAGRSAALAKVRTTVLSARNHPSVMTHSVANELSPYADSMPGTRSFLTRAWRIARDLDDTVPASLDLLAYPNIPRQRSYSGFGLLGLNSYYGWYRGKAGAQSVERFSRLEPFLRSMKRMYPRQAQMVTEFGAEATYKGPPTVKETFAFQSRYVDRTLEVVDELPWLSGAIYWTAREFYVKPNWDGGARRRGVKRDALHNKGLIRYDGTPKPAFYEARKEFLSTPLYPDG